MRKKARLEKVVHGRITNKEWEKLSNYLKRRGLTVSAWLREKVNGIRI